MDYNSGNVSRIRISGRDYSIKDEPLRSSFVKLSEIMKSNNQEIRNFMSSSEMNNSYLSYNLNSATSFLYAFSEICINHISKLYNEITYLKDDIHELKYDVSYLQESLSYSYDEISYLKYNIVELQDDIAYLKGAISYSYY